MQTLKNHGKQLWRQNYNKFSLIYCDASGLVSINYILNLDSESHFMVDQHFEKKNKLLGSHTNAWNVFLIHKE